MRKEHRDLGPKYSTDWLGGAIFFALLACLAMVFGAILDMIA